MKHIAFLFFLFVLAIFLGVRHLGGEGEIHQNPDPIGSVSGEHRILLELHNAKRTARGLPKLELDDGLCKYAQGHAERMARNNSLTHSSMGDLQKFSGAEVVGENIAWGQDTADEVVTDWMWSPGHRWNILGSSYNKVGFGLAKDGKGRNYWCVVFSS